MLYRQKKINYRLDYDQILELLGDKTWVVHNTKPTIDTTTLEDYLARYINRVAVSNSKVEYFKEQEKVKLVYNDYSQQEEGKPAPKGIKILDLLAFIEQFIQHVLPPYFQKSRRYGIHASATKKKLKDLIPDAIKRNGHIIRTVFQILTQLLAEKPYECEKCKSTDYDILVARPNKEWVHRYIHVPTARPPPIKPNISHILF